MACCIPFKKVSRRNDEDGEGSGSYKDSFIWSKELEKHFYGEFSFAAVQANIDMEDFSQVETATNGTFVGVYDGHGGAEAPRYVTNHLLKNLMAGILENGAFSSGVLRNAIIATENGFLTLAERSHMFKSSILSTGSCCIVGVIQRGRLDVANLGDSRAVVGYLDRSMKIVAEQLTRDHNACTEDVRTELKVLHPDDPEIVVFKNGAWRIKGIIQVSRSIGDAYLKQPKYCLDPALPFYQVLGPNPKAVVTSEPSLYTRALQTNDKFLIFASDGLWDHVTNQEAAAIVHNNNHNRAGIARRLVRKALHEAARKSEMSYNDLKKLGKEERRSCHDDITVVVIFLDHDIFEKNVSVVQGRSVTGLLDTATSTIFNIPSQS